MVPANDEESPRWRCAERILWVNVGTAGYPSGGGEDYNIKLIKRNLFSSRRCDGPGIQSATLRPNVNLLVAAGDAGTYRPAETSEPADLPVVRLDTGNALDAFRHDDSFTNGSSTALALWGLYGDYVLLFPSGGLDDEDLEALFDFNLRFDIISVDDTPAQQTTAADTRIEVHAGDGPLLVD
jgi:hypothetical protein